MYILLKYDYSNDERIILHSRLPEAVLGYKISNTLDELKTPVPIINNEIVTIWPGDYILNQVENKFYNEAIKLAKQCVREYNLIKILEK